MIRTLTLALLVTAILAAGAQATTDPRKCPTASTPGPATEHAYWCAKTAAINTVRTTMAKTQHQTHWYSPTFCNQAGTLLRWSCVTMQDGHTWNVTVIYRATSKGWTVRTVIVPH